MSNGSSIDTTGYSTNSERKIENKHEVEPK